VLLLGWKPPGKRKNSAQAKIKINEKHSFKVAIFPSVSPKFAPLIEALLSLP
jgi:hypothetical protein